ncbi:hypothetical protein F4818DRAFT_129646 [Hypoxylon cercidicola]|nr:hypothetical protein F4818DRAFT_129646 [Hypoxylon cercidicola]
MTDWIGWSSESEDGGSVVFRQSVVYCIDAVQAAGSFATGNSIQEFPNPVISIDGGELISLPLSEEGARALASQSRKAPFGKDGQTVVDETVRKTYEIGADKISFLNPAWSSFVNELVQQVAHELGVPRAANGDFNVRAELYKNLLYEPGSMFKAHKDTEKVAGMFGTLVICLPSPHTGGAVCLQHGNESLRLPTEESSAFDCFVLAWYADVSHEIETVQTGHRWVLTYNLIHDEAGSSCPSASVLDSQTEQLVQALSLWRDHMSMPSFLAYPLSHQYTTKYLGLAHLKGHDYDRARHLAAGCARHGGFYLFLAHVEVTKSWVNDEEGDNTIQYQRTLHTVGNLDGVKLSHLHVSLAKGYLLDSMYHPDEYNRDPDSRWGGEYIGNQHAEFEETYLDRVLIIVPKEFVMSVFLDNPYSHNDLNRVMALLRETVHETCHYTDTSTRELLFQLCDNVLNNKP